MSQLVTATFKTRHAAEDALHHLEAIGVAENQISLVATDNTRGRHFNLERHSQIDQGVAGGAIAGGLIGMALGSLSVGGTIVIPALSLMITGAFVGAVTGLAMGAVIGGLIGGLIGAGMPAFEAKVYDNEVHDGAVLIAVEPRDGEQKDDIKRTLTLSEAQNLAT